MHVIHRRSRNTGEAVADLSQTQVSMSISDGSLICFFFVFLFLSGLFPFGVDGPFA
jgi:hypothetical protein